MDDPPYTPLYDSLYTNVAVPFLGFPSFPFPPETPLYPTAERVRQYLEEYAAYFDITRYIRFKTRVEETRWDAKGQVWKIRLPAGEWHEFEFVVVASGHHRKPRYPDVPGVKKWVDEGRAFHSSWYRRPSELAHHKKVVVVGAGLSALDIVAEMRTVSKLLLQSVSGGSYWIGQALPPDDDGYRTKPKIAEYKDNGVLVFEDGTTESDVDFVIFATGFEHSFPFFAHLTNDVWTPSTPLPDHLQISSYAPFPLARFLFPLQKDFPAHSIAFTGLMNRIAPLPIFEDQARAIAHAFANPGVLDIAAESAAIIKRAQSLVQEVGSNPLDVAKAWVFFKPHEPFEYRAELNAFAGIEWQPMDGEIECWDRKHELRTEWKAIVGDGESEKWLKGVGVGGLDEWVDLCREVLERYDSRHGSVRDT